MAEVDWDDPLLNVPAPKAAAERTPLVERAAEVLERINAFVATHDRPPVSEKGRPVPERILANDLAGLRASKADLAGLAPFDAHGLIFPPSAPLATPFDDPLLAGAEDIFTIDRTLQEKARPDFIADRLPCPDFDRFAGMFDRVRQAVEEGARVPRRFRQDQIEQGEVFRLNDQLVFVADIRDRHQRHGRPDARLRVIYDNATESNLLMSSLVRALQKDKGGMRIAVSSAGPLFEGAPTGFVYVVRSRSDRPEVADLVKVGTTAGAVEDRVARAETQAAFLFAAVEILDTYALTGYAAAEAEQMLHRLLRPFHVPLRVTGPDGRAHQATEWFRVSPEDVSAAVKSLFGPPAGQ